MTKFNQKTPGTSTRTPKASAAPTSFITTKSTPPVYSPATEVTGNGAPGWARDTQSELFLLAVTNMVSEDTFYEGASGRDRRFRELVRKVATAGPESGQWMARFIPWLRSEANMRTASIVAAVEAADAQRKASPGAPTLAREFLKGALQRPDEPGEALAYAKSRGIKVSGGIQRGIADAAQRMFTERNLLKYDGQSKDFRFADVLELTHPSPKADWQGDLFKYAIDRRHNRDGLTIPASLAMLRVRSGLEGRPVEMRRQLFDGTITPPFTIDTPDGSFRRVDSLAEVLEAGGMTWESLSGWLQGPMDAKAWEAIIPSMGYMALLRNLRNFDQAGVSDKVAATIAAKLADADEVAKSRQFPMRFLSAYKAAPSLRWSWALEQALGHSLSNVPVLKGRTLILVDRSGSMFDTVSQRTGLNRADSAAVFGSALAQRSESADLVQYGTSWSAVKVQKGESLLKVIEKFGSLGGTNTAQTAQATFKNHDRVVVVTDEQANAYGYGYGYGASSRSTLNDVIPSSVPLYTWNLAGYRVGNTPAGELNRHTFGGLTDTAFKMIGLLERGQSTGWPWDEK